MKNSQRIPCRFWLPILRVQLADRVSRACDWFLRPLSEWSYRLDNARIEWERKLERETFLATATPEEIAQRLADEEWQRQDVQRLTARIGEAFARKSAYMDILEAGSLPSVTDDHRLL